MRASIKPGGNILPQPLGAFEPNFPDFGLSGTSDSFLELVCFSDEVFYCIHDLIWFATLVSNSRPGH